jgi:FkbM family methyltransferase
MDRSPQTIFTDSIKVAIDYHGRRKELLREYAFDAMARFVSTVSVETEAGRFYVSTRDKEVGRGLFVRGAHDDMPILRRIVEHLHERTAGGFALTGKTFVDVGANIGTTTVAALTAFGARTAYAFEPAPENYRLLRQNVLANDLDDRVVAVQVAVSDHSGAVDLELSTWNWGDHRVRHSGGDAAANDHATVVAVPAHTLDELVEQQPIALENVALIWIDVQGHEPSVLAGARKTIQSGTPVVAEYWPHGLERSGLERFEELVRRDFGTWADVRRLDAHGRLIERPTDEIGELRAAYPGLAFTDVLLLS